MTREFRKSAVLTLPGNRRVVPFYWVFVGLTWVCGIAAPIFFLSFMVNIDNIKYKGDPAELFGIAAVSVALALIFGMLQASSSRGLEKTCKVIGEDFFREPMKYFYIRTIDELKEGCESYLVSAALKQETLNELYVSRKPGVSIDDITQAKRHFNYAYAQILATGIIYDGGYGTFYSRAREKMEAETASVTAT